MSREIENLIENMSDPKTWTSVTECIKKLRAKDWADPDANTLAHLLDDARMTKRYGKNARKRYGRTIRKQRNY